MHFKMASQGAPTVHESAKKSGAETDSNAKTATNDNHELGGTRSTTKHILDLVDSTKPETSASVASTTSTDGVVA